MDLRAYQRHSDGFDQLSLRDLLAARDLYHVHLMNHPGVVATAVGLYRIRKDDSWPGARHEVRHTYARTLANSEVRSYSSPAVLVFVREWHDEQDFAPDAGELGPKDLIPPTLDLPDGRRVPVCVIQSPPDEQMAATAAVGRHPINNIGGGSPVFVTVQGREHFATIACLVSDGHTAFAVTNRHVAGEAGTEITSELGGKRATIGHSATKSLARVPFERLYPGWPGHDTYVNVDVGLIEINDLDGWTAKVADVGEIGPMADLSVDNLSLAVIGCQVRGHGAATGAMRGEIQALFYRYESGGGFEYVADVLIGPRATGNGNGEVGDFATHHGDSGTLWLLEPVHGDGVGHASTNGDRPHHNGRDGNQYLPLAVQWGHEQFVAEGRSQGYVLATFLSRVCALLEVDPIRDWNLDVPETWGAVGHFSIAARAINALSPRAANLKKLMSNNLSVISYDDQTILTNGFSGMTDDEIIPMADVPDLYWKHGRQGHTRGSEGPNHFADMDQPRPSDGKTLLDLCKDPANVDPDVWNKFYESVTDLSDGKRIGAEHRGLLPFRVWEIFDAMVGYAKRGRAPEFVCAAGVLAHYVGDACQPLHISYLHDGDPLRATTKAATNGHAPVKIPLGSGVHSAYEDEMINAHRQQVLDALDDVPSVKKSELVTTGHEAAIATVALMRKTIQRLPPAKIVDVFVAYTGAKADRAAYMWKHCGTGTKKAMIDGTHLLAVLWQSAWAAGNGESTVTSTDAIDAHDAMAIVADSKHFVPSLTIDKVGAQLS